MSTLKSKVMLVILDGFGVAKDPNVSAIDQANMPYYKSLISVMPNTLLSASGEDVGLPCLLYTSPSPRDGLLSRMPSSA